ncbi:MAG: hypothetical protein JWR89_4026 [Tardiphaga sp.]|uniref:hypothetical protein n=1 Tax=Tardiphaga sp. TaxID=1926292 RepID=UPI00260B082C|nr:hypothetical protein [Tardiphaga sp.]MDB5504124.1 hypothetical protein [Tardiphaga sp.]
MSEKERDDPPGKVDSGTVLQFPDVAARPSLQEWAARLAGIRRAVRYRVEAADLGQRSREAADEVQVKACLMEALALIQLAENEEWLLGHAEFAAEARLP